VRDGIKANSGKIIAGGYNKAMSRMGAAPPNRVLIVRWPDKDPADKTWAEYTQKCRETGGSKICFQLP